MLISSASKLDSHSIPCDENVPQLDALDMQNSSSSAGRQALADFLGSMVTQKAHWYSLAVDSNDPNNAELSIIFPTLSSLLSIEHETMISVLQLCRLVQRRRGKPSLMLDAWSHFIAEKRIDVEITTFTVLEKRRYFIRIGSWNKLRHPASLPVNCWRNEIHPPKLRISGLTRVFAECVGQLNIVTSVSASSDFNSESYSSTEDESECEGKESDSEEKESEEKKGSNRTEEFFPGSRSEMLSKPNLTYPSAQFPMLHSLGVCSTTHMDKLLQEIVQLHGGKSISYTRGNNRRGTLAVLPSNRTLQRYKDDFMKSGSALDIILQSIANSTASTVDDAASCLLSVLFSKFEDSFVSVAMENGVMEGSIPKKMDIVATEAMLQEANINNTNARVLFRHLNQFFGRSYFESEQKRRNFFGDTDFPPTVDKVVLEDKTVIPFWYKSPDEVLQKQLPHMIDESKLKDLRKVDIVVGGDHGGGKFRMTLKVNFRLDDNSTVSYLTQVASVSFSKDETKILKETVLNPIGRGLQRIMEEARFIVTDKLTLSFSNVDNSSLLYCDCPIEVFLVGDLKFYAQMGGREGMSSYWCIWCTLHPSEWKNYKENQGSIAEEDQLPWTVDLHNETLQMIRSGQLKEPKDKKGVVDDPIWPFIEPRNYIFPHLHFEIGVVNMVLENLYAFVEEQVEIVSPEEKVARNSIVIAEASLEQGKDRLEVWHTEHDHEVARLRLERSYIASSLRGRGLSNEQRICYTLERDNKDREITQLIQQRKDIEKELTSRRKVLAQKKKDFQELVKKKKKIDLPVTADLENILNGYNITAAAYHGGKLNGVDCRELIRLTKEILPLFQAQLLNVSHPERCSSDTIVQTCEVHNDLFATLDLISSKIRLKHKEPTQQDYDVLERSLHNLDYLWKVANLSYTPKIHSILAHALEQMKRLEGIGDMLEDDVEHIHQMAARIETRTSRMNNKALQPFIHSKVEAIQNSHAIKEKITESQRNAKRAFKKRNPDAVALEKNAKLKTERDKMRIETMQNLEKKPHSNLDPIKFKSNK